MKTNIIKPIAVDLQLLAVFILQTYNASGRLWANDRLVRPFSSSCITAYKDGRETHYKSGRSKSWQIFKSSFGLYPGSCQIMKLLLFLFCVILPRTIYIYIYIYSQ